MQACDNGRGAILLGIARGKVSEGVDFGVWCVVLVCGVGVWCWCGVLVCGAGVWCWCVVLVWGAGVWCWCGVFIVHSYIMK